MPERLPGTRHTATTTRALSVARLAGAVTMAMAIQVRGDFPVAWQSYKFADGLASSGCSAVTTTPQGRVLARTINPATIAVLDGYSVKTVPVPQEQFGKVYEVASGQFWTVLAGRVAQFENGTWNLLPIAASESSAPEPVLDILPLKPSRVLALSSSRLMTVAVGGGMSGEIPSTVVSSTRDSGAFRCVTAGQSGVFWVAADHELSRISVNSSASDKPLIVQRFPTPANVTQGVALNAHENPDGTLTAVFAAGTNKIIATFDGQSWSSTECGNNDISHAWRTADKALWGLSTNMLLRRGAGEKAFFEVDAASGRRYNDVALEPGGTFWLATSSGLLRYSPPLWRRVAGAAETLYGDAHGRNRQVSRSGSGALLQVDDANYSFPPELTNAQVSAKLETLNGDVWFGSDHGTALLHNKHWQMFAASTGANPESPTCFVELPDGRIWAAATDTLWEFNGRAWFSLRRGFDTITSLCLARDGSIWLSSHNGLYRFVHDTWIEFGPEEGLPSAPVFDVGEDTSGRLWTKSAAGLFQFYPEADRDPPQPMINDFTGGTRTIREGSFLNMVFTGVDRWKLSTPSRLFFGFRLDDRDWSPFQQIASASFADLPAGKHSFQVRAMDRNGNISGSPGVITFSVTVPWYRESRLVVISSVAAIIVLIFAALAYNRHRRLLLSYAEIEKIVAQRTRELDIANQQLVHGQKMTALGTLAAGIAHDFNNILSIVKGSAQIIEENLHDPRKIALRIERIKTVVEQGAGVVKAMLGFSREPDLQQNECDPNEAVAETMKLLGDRFAHEVQLDFTPGENLPPVRCSRDFVQQVLLNFIFNAAEASERKRILIATRTLASARLEGFVLPPAQADACVAISVQDFGAGIAPENLPRIFEPFFTTKAMSARRGTGLGLSMVYELAKKIGAGLRVETSLGRGSTFTIVLPVAQSILNENGPRSREPILTNAS